MKLEDGGDALVSVKACTDTDDILLATAGGKCIRFSVSDVRVFAGRTSTGVRGIKLAQGAEGDDRVISMSILRSGEAESIEERDAYLRYANAKRRSENGGEGGAGESGNGEDGPNGRSEEHTSELQSLMRISYAVFCLKKKKK